MDDICQSTKFSGELFDLSIPTLNNKFGYEHISYVMKYGITMPLQKYIDELEMILEDSDGDDKNEKRNNRLDFLVQCNEYSIIQEFFLLFTNYINGGGSGKQTWFDNQYRDQNMIITVAGGNIITVFGELLQNIVDIFILTINDFNDDPWPNEDWDILDDDYEAAELTTMAKRHANVLFNTSFSKWNKSGENIIETGFSYLTKTNKILLEHLEYNSSYPSCSEFDRNKIFFIIAKCIIQNDQLKELTEFISTSTHSDFDFKLSPNIHPYMDLDKDPENERTPAAKLLKKLERIDVRNHHAGFALLRAKSVMVCEDEVTYYSPQTLKKLKRSCADSLRRQGEPYSWVYSLFPQIMQEKYLEDFDEESDCYIYLNYLLEKKNQISEATSENVSEIVKFYLTGYNAPENKYGEEIPILPSSDNSTEAIIAYLNYTSYNLNVYLKYWLDNKLSKFSAPGGNWLRERFSNYDNLCAAFVSLDTLLYDEKSCVLRMASDVITYFLNNPVFNTENILDSLVETINNKRESQGLEGNCFMPPSDVVLAPNEKDLYDPLKLIKEILEESKFTELGFPDGIRITINAISTEATPPYDEEEADEYEESVEELLYDDPGGEYTPFSEFVTLRSRSIDYEDEEEGEEEEEEEEDEEEDEEDDEEEEEDEEQEYGGKKSRKTGKKSRKTGKKSRKTGKKSRKTDKKSRKTGKKSRKTGKKSRKTGKK